MLLFPLHTFIHFAFKLNFKAFHKITLIKTQ